MPLTQIILIFALKHQKEMKYLKIIFTYKILIKFMLLSMVVLTTGSCDRYKTVREKLNVAENLMNAHPDSALAILDNIPSAGINDREVAARYALLKSIALDKNCIDTTTFDVLQPAIDYYVKNGTPDEQFRTYYYQGRIYQNQGDDDSAMRSFMNGCDLRHGVTDSLLLAHTLVAQGTLYFKQYKINDFVHYNMEAAKLYKTIGKDILAIKSYTNALDGYVMQNNKPAADSLMSICVPMVKKNPEGEAFLFPSLLSYTVNFCSSDEIKEVLTEYQNMELTTDETMIFAEGYSKIGEYDKAMTLISNINPAENTWDSLKYASIKIDILERQGKYKEAFTLYRDYSATLEHYQKELLSHDLLFSDKKHQLEMKNLIEIQDRDRIIGGTLCGIFALVILVGWLYYRGYRSKTKRILAEKENKNLRLEQENLRLEIDQLEDERDNLKELQKEQSELAKPIKDVIKSRLDLLNGLLAKEITNNDCYAEPYNKWIDTVRNDKKKFMDSTRLAFAASHPKFMEYLEQHGLSTDEINYLCLYAIGLRGKEVGEYTQMKRHYIVSHEIRKKFGIDEHETNIGLYIRRLMKDFEK